MLLGRGPGVYPDALFVPSFWMRITGFLSRCTHFVRCGAPSRHRSLSWCKWELAPSTWWVLWGGDPSTWL